MEIRTVGNLRSYLEREKISPERLGKTVRISNMTIRRFLRKRDDTAIPEKYHLQFDMLAMGAHTMPIPGATTGFDRILHDLRESGSKKVDLGKLEDDVKDKLEDTRLDQTLRSSVKKLVTAVFSTQLSTQKKAICIGALLYLMNPLDMIPDTIPVLGYLDDFAIISLVLAYIVNKSKDLKA